MEITLTVSAAPCPKCGEFAEPGPCPKCGTEVPPPDVPSAEEQNIAKAIGRFREQFEALQSRIDELPNGTVPITDEQFGQIAIELNVAEKTADLVKVFDLFDGLNLNDSSTVGKKLPKLMVKLLDASTPLVEVAEETCWFQSPKGRELKQETLGIARNAVAVGVQLFEVLTGETVVEKRTAEISMQAALDSISHERLIEILSEAVAVEPSMDERVGRAVGRQGAFADAKGMIDESAVFMELGGGDQPLASVARSARRYFQDVLPEVTESSSSVAWDALLISSAVRLSTLDSPVLGHRVARGTYDLATRAFAEDETQVREIARRFLRQVPRMVAVREAIQHSIHSLVRDEEDGVLTEERAVLAHANNYRRTVESGYRICGWVLRQLESVANGESIADQTELPRVTDLVNQLASSKETVAVEFASHVDIDLRNAEAHDELFWDEDAEEAYVFGKEDGNRWDLDSVNNALEHLASVYFGALAGIECFLAAHDIDEESSLPNPVRFATNMARMLFGAIGIRFVSVDKTGLIQVETPDSPVPVARLAGPSMSTFLFLQDAQRVRVEAEGGEVLLDISDHTVEMIKSAGPTNSMLAVPIAILDHVDRTGGKAELALRETLALQVRVLVHQTAAAVEKTDPRTDPTGGLLADLEKRIEFILESTSTSRGMGSQRNRRVITKLKRLLKLVRSMSSGSTQKDWNQLVRRVEGLETWAEEIEPQLMDT